MQTFSKEMQTFLMKMKIKCTILRLWLPLESAWKEAHYLKILHWTQLENTACNQIICICVCQGWRLWKCKQQKSQTRRLLTGKLETRPVFYYSEEFISFMALCLLVWNFQCHPSHSWIKNITEVENNVKRMWDNKESLTV